MQWHWKLGFTSIDSQGVLIRGTESGLHFSTDSASGGLGLEKYSISLITNSQERQTLQVHGAERM